MEACTNPDILKVIHFFLLIIDIVKIIIPIALIVLGIIDFSKSVTSSDEKIQKKTTHLFLKRLLYAILVFLVPWIVEVLMVTIGNAFGEEVNFTDCIENANSKTIDEIENGTYGNHCYVCVRDDTIRVYQKELPKISETCKAWKKTDLSKEECREKEM